MSASKGARLRWGAAAMLALVVLVVAAVLGSRSYCLGRCRGPLLDCTETDRIMRRAIGGDEASRRRVVRLRTVLDGVNPITCGDVPWNVDTIHWGVADAMGRATANQQPVTLTLRFVGLVADAPYTTLEVLGLEVRGFDDWRTALAVLLDLEQEPPWEADRRSVPERSLIVLVGGDVMEARSTSAGGSRRSRSPPGPASSTISTGSSRWRSARGTCEKRSASAPVRSSAGTPTAADATQREGHQ